MAADLHNLAFAPLHISITKGLPIKVPKRHRPYHPTASSTPMDSCLIQQRHKIITGEPQGRPTIEGTAG